MFKIAFRPIRLGRTYSTTTEAFAQVDAWAKSCKPVILSDSLHPEPLSDLYITLPTRDGTRIPPKTPQVGAPLGYGHHLALFHSRLPESQLRHDATEGDFCPPEPFTRRMWAGGKITWDLNNPLLIGSKATATCSLGEVKKKEGKNPIVFATQRIEIVTNGKHAPSVVEDRTHVYLTRAAGVNSGARNVEDMPTSSDFSFTYTPSLITLFRFSALMFNAHHIHLDQEYAQKKEGYPERLVHGPLTAMMLLEAAVYHNPNIKIRSFEYRARNPVIVNRPSTIKGKQDRDTIQLWCEDDDGVVGMTGSVNVV